MIRRCAQRARRDIASSGRNSFLRRPSKLAEILLRGGNVGGVRLFGGVESAEMDILVIDLDASKISTCSFFQGDAFQRHVARPSKTIRCVLRVSRKTKICPTIIFAVEIGVID